MTEEQLQEIENRHAKTSAGEWWFGNWSFSGETPSMGITTSAPSGDTMVMPDFHPEDIRRWHDDWVDQLELDLDFMARSHQDVPLLVREVKFLNGLIQDAGLDKPHFARSVRLFRAVREALEVMNKASSSCDDLSDVLGEIGGTVQKARDILRSALLKEAAEIAGVSSPP